MRLSAVTVIIVCRVRMSMTVSALHVSHKLLHGKESDNSEQYPQPNGKVAIITVRVGVARVRVGMACVRVGMACMGILR